MQIKMLGRAPYLPTYEAMQAYTVGRQADSPDELWLCEHPPVFTQGLAGSADHLLAPGEIPVVQSNRGGQVTYHGPGQVMAYPLVNLQRAQGAGPVRRGPRDGRHRLPDVRAGSLGLRAGFASGSEVHIPDRGRQV
jgi:lipoate-protein ligase B